MNDKFVEICRLAIDEADSLKRLYNTMGGAVPRVCIDILDPDTTKMQGIEKVVALTLLAAYFKFRFLHPTITDLDSIKMYMNIQLEEVGSLLTKAERKAREEEA